jgi:hypothetical protein
LETQIKVLSQAKENFKEQYLELKETTKDLKKEFREIET